MPLPDFRNHSCHCDREGAQSARPLWSWTQWRRLDWYLLAVCTVPSVKTFWEDGVCVCSANTSSGSALGRRRKRCEGAGSHPVVVLLDEVAVLLQDLVQPGLDAVLAAAERVAVVVQQSVHVGALHHLNQDRGELAFQSQQTLQSRAGRRADRQTFISTPGCQTICNNQRSNFLQKP